MDRNTVKEQFNFVNENVWCSKSLDDLYDMAKRIGAEIDITNKEENLYRVDYKNILIYVELVENGFNVSDYVCVYNDNGTIIYEDHYKDFEFWFEELAISVK